jgi:hypothetical protein
MLLHANGPASLGGERCTLLTACPNPCMLMIICEN